MASGYFEAGLQANELCVWRVPRSVRVEDAQARLRTTVDDFDCRFASGQLQVVAFGEGEPFVLEQAEQFWLAKLDYAIAGGFEGLRASGDASVLDTAEQSDEYERVLDALVSGRPTLALCTYSLASARAMDVFDVERAHNLTVARRNGAWQFMENPELQRAHAFGIWTTLWRFCRSRFPDKICSPNASAGCSRFEQRGRARAWDQPAHHPLSPRQYH